MRRRPAIVVVAWLLAAGWLAGCGSREPEPSRELTVLVAGDFDSIDPGTAAEPTSNQVLNSIHRRLYAAFPGGRRGVQPDLAAGPPEISDGGRTVAVALRSGVRFSPPLDREVVADDIRYGIERLFLPGLRGFATTAFQDIAGADRALGGEGGRLEGIETPNRRRIVFRLRRAVAGTFVQQALTFAHAVPRDYAARYDRRGVLAYARHQVATGPYRFLADGAGAIGPSGYRPGVGARLVRNPNWDPAHDFRPAHLDGIRFRLGNDDADVAIRRVVGGRALATAGIEVPAARLRGLSGPERARVFTPAVRSGVIVLWLNTSAPPFDDLRVRRAVLAGFDRAGALQTLGGPLFGEVATHLLAPHAVGHEQSGGRAGPGLDVLASPAGDDALARRLLARAPRPPRRSLTLVVPAALERLGEMARGELAQLGFEVRLRPVPEPNIGSACGDRRSPVQACISSFVLAVPDPGVFFAVQLSGATVSQPLTFNFSRLAAAAENAAAQRSTPRRARVILSDLLRRLMASIFDRRRPQGVGEAP